MIPLCDDMNMDSNDLTFFSAVASAGAIGRAALTLNTVQSNVTQHIRALELKLGAPLFHRSKKGVTLTSVGERLLPFAVQIATLLREAERVASDQTTPQGVLRIGSLETTVALRLPAILSAYASAYPQVDLQVETGPTGVLVEEVLERRLDGAFVSGPVRHHDLVATAMVEEELVVATASHVEDLGLLRGGAKILVFRAGCSYRQRTEEFLARLGLLGLRRMEMGTLDGIIGCVSAGIGFTLLPRAVLKTAATAGQVRLHELSPEARWSTTMFVQRRDAYVSAALRRFVECAAERTAGLRDPRSSEGSQTPTPS